MDANRYMGRKQASGLLWVGVAAAGFCLTASASHRAASADEFVSVSPDNVRIHAQIDLPEEPHPRVAVLLVPGTGGFNRDVKFGSSGTERDLIFRDLARDLTMANFAVIRFDERGYDCVKGAACPDENVVGGTTPQTKADDLRVVAATALVRLKLPQKCLLVVAHSEGTLNVARATQSGNFSPGGIVALSGIFRSPVAATKWQMSGRTRKVLSDIDDNADGYVDRTELLNGWKKAVWSKLPPPLHLLRGSVSVTKKAFDDSLAEIDAAYARARQAALAADGAMPFRTSDGVKGNILWWKQWFSDDLPVSERFSSYSGRLIAIFGNEDPQIDVLAEATEAGQIPSNVSVNVIKLDGVGHTLGQHPVFGPIALKSKRVITESLRKLSQC